VGECAVCVVVDVWEEQGQEGVGVVQEAGIMQEQQGRQEGLVQTESNRVDRGERARKKSSSYGEYISDTQISDTIYTNRAVC
jgi:hypothetical protein